MSFAASFCSIPYLAAVGDEGGRRASFHRGEGVAMLGVDSPQRGEEGAIPCLLAPEHSQIGCVANPMVRRDDNFSSASTFNDIHY